MPRAGAHGQGGLLEVSSAGLLTYGGHANATAASGQQGQLLLDPANLDISDGVGLPQFNLLNPDPDVLDTFGNSMVVLTNGNVVVTDPTSGLAALNAGAVFLYNGQTGALLATLTGSTTGDQVGSGGVTALTNGNFVVSSPNWQSNNVAVGAATWCSGTGDSVMAVSADNSLVGVTSGDQIGGDGVTALVNGNYVVSSPFWQDAGNQVGAVTWGNGLVGTAGQVSAANSLIGSTSFDDVGSDGVTPLTNGNYVVSSSFWQNPNGSGGAVTWGNGLGGTVGPVSAANSLVGDVDSGEIGPAVTALTDGNYVVDSPGWQNAGDPVGAVTWGNGSSGTVGLVSMANSLTGSTTFDEVGSGGVQALPGGNYVVSSPDWQNGFDDVGAVTWALPAAPSAPSPPATASPARPMAMTLAAAALPSSATATMSSAAPIGKTMASPSAPSPGAMATAAPWATSPRPTASSAPPTATPSASAPAFPAAASSP